MAERDRLPQFPASLLEKVARFSALGVNLLAAGINLGIVIWLRRWPMAAFNFAMIPVSLVIAYNVFTQGRETWVSKVLQSVSTACLNPLRWCYQRSLSRPASQLRRLARFLFRRRRDLVIKGQAAFVNDTINGSISVLTGAAATFSNCYITAPAGTGAVITAAGGTSASFATGGVVFSSGANAYPGTIAPPKPPSDLPVVERTVPIVGFRGWAIRGDPDLGIVLGASNDRFGDWKSNKATEAECHAMAPFVGEHEAPFRACGCGLYLMRRLDDVALQTGPRVVRGAVVSWGRIIEHTDGFRAQFAQPIALLSGTYLAALVARELKLPLLNREHLETYAKEFGELM